MALSLAKRERGGLADGVLDMDVEVVCVLGAEDEEAMVGRCKRTMWMKDLWAAKA